MTHPAANLKRFISPLVQWRYEPWAKTLWKTCPPVTLWQGRTLQTQQPLSIVYAGTVPANAAFWINTLIQDKQKQPLGNHWIGSLPSLLKNKYPQASLLIVEKTWISPLLSFLHKGFLVPHWVQMEIDISKPIDKMTVAEREGFDDILRQIRKYNLFCEFTDDPQRCEEFFHSMHTPFIRNRHEDESFFMSLKRARAIFKNAELCLVKKDGEVLGGSIVQRGRRVFLRLIGLKDGNVEYRKYGVLGAAYYFSIKRLQEQGHQVLDIGGSDPVLNSGLTRFKSFLKAKIIPNTYLPLQFAHFLSIRSDPALSEALGKVQILYHPKYFHPLRAVFIDAEELNNQDAVREKLTSKSPLGIRGTEVYISGDYKSADARWLENERLVQSVRSLNSKLLFP